MSLLSRNELSIVLCPERIALLRTESRLTLRGYQRYVHARKILECEIVGDGEKPWKGVVKTLEMALPPLVGRKMGVNVILSNHFMQYVLVPSFDKSSERDEMALAQHCFMEMNGAATHSLSVRISQGRAGSAALASAVDRELLEDIGGLMGRMGLGIRSIRSHLMVAYNSCRAVLEGRSAWVALLEPGNLCLAVLQKGQLVWIRKMRIGDDWREELPRLLEREACLTEAEVALDEVFLWAPHLEDTDIPTGWRWKIQHLKPGMKLC